ncbi:RAMP superfamily CRISPR-associated protein [Actinomadura rubrobrunea]|nr:RAMP superfamily CRISPR-associated protein [Actinomadura rubrobrunea]
MLSDWHIGTGTARHGLVDRVVQRDGRGLPFVPAKTLIGVWRDACEVAASALDSGPTGVWHDWVEYLFGTQSPSRVDEEARAPEQAVHAPRPAALMLEGALSFPGRLGEVLADRPQLLEAVTFVKPGVAIDARTGAAADDKLRYEEMARGGLTLTGAAELHGAEALDPDQRACALGLLWIGAELLESIGGKRRRGAGRCRLELTASEAPPSMERLQQLAQDPAAPPPPPAVADCEPERHQSSDDASWERVALTFTLETPLLAHDRALGNLDIGRDHIPGWMLLPAVLRHLDSAAAAAAARRGDLVVTPATPVVGGGRGRPVPGVLARVKDEPGRLINRMVQKPDEPVERFRAGYVPADSDGPISVARPNFVLRMHNTVHDHKQRPTSDLGGVYVYQALEPGTELAAEIRVRTGILPKGWHERLPSTWRLGRSRKDDYGLVRVKARPIQDQSPRPEQDALREGDLLRVWLLSDVLVLGPRLNPSGDPADLARALQDAFTAAGATDVRLEPHRSDNGMANAYDVARTDSWHTAWRLPRPSLLGLAAGGCLTFRVTNGRIPAKALSAVELAGVGLRRGEGFGQVRFNDPLLTAPMTRREQKDPEPEADPNGKAQLLGTAEAETDPSGRARLLGPDEAGHKEARVIERAAWRAEIRRRAEQCAADADNEVLHGLTELSASRLNSIRSLLTRLDAEPDDIRRRIARLTARWDAPQVQQALEALLVDEDKVWDVLGLPTPELFLTKDAEQQLRRELRPEALRTLLTACVAAHTRRLARQERAAVLEQAGRS